jgi:uncharacterized protein with GYD domain
MTTFICQGRYTTNALQGMLSSPEDRTQSVRRLFREAGGKLVAYYLTFGEYDWLVIAEAPDEKAMLSAILAAASGGSLTDLKTTVAMTTEDTVRAFEDASRLATSFKSAGQEAPARQSRSEGRSSGAEGGQARGATASRGRGRGAKK